VAYPTHPVAAAQQPRPTTVTVSSYLLRMTAAISLIGAGLTLSMVGRMTDVYRDLFAGTQAEGTEAVVVGLSVIGVIINILFATGLAILSIFNNRGRNGARITTWVLGGVSLCCGGLGLASTAVTSAMNLDSLDGGPSASEVDSRLNEVLPSWYEPVSTTLSVTSSLAILCAVILLALPASNAYFRKPVTAGWDPSLPYPYTPSGQPPVGGQSPHSAYPAHPTTGEPWAPPPSSGGYTPAPPSSSGPPADQSPHTGSIPPIDPWEKPPADDRRPPSDPDA